MSEETKKLSDKLDAVITENTALKQKVKTQSAVIQKLESKVKTLESNNTEWRKEKESAMKQIIINLKNELESMKLGLKVKKDAGN